MEQTELVQIARRNQEQSPLLRLPAELRIKIYEYALGGWRICLRVKHELDLTHGTAHQHGHEDETSDAEAEIYCISSESPDPYWRRTKHIFALTRVCHQTYAESNLIPFSHNDFGGDIPALLHAFKSEFFNEERRQLITSMHVLFMIKYLTKSCDMRNGNMECTLQALTDLPHLAQLTIEWSAPYVPRNIDLTSTVESTVQKAITEQQKEGEQIDVQITTRSSDASWTNAWRFPDRPRPPPERNTFNFGYGMAFLPPMAAMSSYHNPTASSSRQEDYLADSVALRGNLHH